MSEHFDAADVSSAADEAEEKEIVLIKVVVGERIGPVMVSVESRDASRGAMQELFSAAGAALLSCSRSLASACDTPAAVVLAAIAQAATEVMLREDSQQLMSKPHKPH